MKKYKYFLDLFFQTLRSLSQNELISVASLGLVAFVASAFLVFSGGIPSESDVKGGIYSEGLTGSLSVLNPLFVDFNPVDRDVSALIFSGLTRYNPKTKSFDSDLGDYVLSKDKKTYTFTVKDNLFWHDEKPLTVEDVYFTFKYVIQSKDFKNPVLKANFLGVEIEKLKDNQISFTLKEPNSFFITNTSVGILPKHLFEDILVKDLMITDLNKHPVGSGPYVFESASLDKGGIAEVNLTQFDKYYGDKSDVSRIRFFVFETKDDLLKGHGRYLATSKASLDDKKALEEQERFNFYPYELPQYTAIFINTDQVWLKNKKVRLALQKSIDKEQLLRFLNYRKVIDTPLLSLDQKDWLYKHNVDEAKGALYESGWKLAKKEKGEIRKNWEGKELELTLLTRNYGGNENLTSETEKVSNFLKNAFLEIGVRLNIETEFQQEFLGRLKKRDYDLLLYGQSLGYNLDTFSYWHSSQSDKNGLNLSSYRSFKADALIESIREEFDSKEREESLTALAKVIANDIPAVFLYSPTYYFILDKKVEALDLKNLAFPSDRFSLISSLKFKK